MNTPKRQLGLTLLELMVTVSVAGLALTVGIPSFQATIQNNRAVTRANQFIGSLNTARSEAVKRGRPVQICVDTDLSTNACQGSAWHQGWRVWVDEDGDATVDNGETIVVAPAFGGTATLVSTDGVATLQYQPSGFLQTALANGTFQLRVPNCTGASNRDVFIAPTGRPTVAEVDC